MLTRDAIQIRLSAAASDAPLRCLTRLPTRSKADRFPVRTAMLQRLAASRLFAFGDRAGVLRSAQQRSGRPFRLDVRQRVIVKALVSRHVGRGLARGAALAAHVTYLGRSGTALEGERPTFFDRETTVTRNARAELTPTYLNVTVIDPVPEPSTWAFLLLGFGGLGVVLRRRRAKLAA